MQSIGPSDKSEFVDAILREAAQRGGTLNDWILNKIEDIRKTGEKLVAAMNKIYADAKKLGKYQISIYYTEFVKESNHQLIVPLVFRGWIESNRWLKSPDKVYGDLKVKDIQNIIVKGIKKPSGVNTISISKTETGIQGATEWVEITVEIIFVKKDFDLI